MIYLVYYPNFNSQFGIEIVMATTDKQKAYDYARNHIFNYKIKEVKDGGSIFW